MKQPFLSYLLLAALTWGSESHLAMCPPPCPLAQSYSADVHISRTGVTNSTQDYQATGKVGITHELTRGSIVYAVDVNFTYTSTGQMVRKWFAGWNILLEHATRRYLVIDAEGASATCQVEEDSAYAGSDPFQAILDRFVSSTPGLWEYSYGFEGKSHKAQTMSNAAGTSIMGTVLHTYESGEPVSVIMTNYSSVGTSPSEALFWPRNQYNICFDAEKHRVANFSSDTSQIDNACLTDVLTLEYGCL